MIRLKQQISWAVTGKTILIVFIAVLFSVLFIYLPRAFSKNSGQNDETKLSGKEFNRRLAEGVQAVQPSSGQTVAFKSCRVVKPKMGGFRLGAFNVLEIDGLEITLPCVPAETAGTGSSGSGKPTETLRRNLDASRLASVAGLDQRISMFKISGFCLFMTDHNQQRIPVVTARLAKSSGTASVSLEECEVLTEKMERIRTAKAKLYFGETVIFETVGQQVNFDNLAAVLGFHAE